MHEASSAMYYHGNMAIQTAPPSGVPDKAADALGTLREVLSLVQAEAPYEESAVLNPSAFVRVQREQPRLVDDAHMLGFLRAEEFDVKLAAERLLKYWVMRRRLFGEGKYFLPLTLDGAMKDDTRALKSGFLTLLPKPDELGRAIVYLDASKYRSVKLTAEERLRVWWYVLHAAMADPKITDAGFVVLINAKDYVLADYLPRFTVGICTSASYFPIKWCAAHLCQCNAAVYSMIATGVRASMSQEQREMFFVHPGSAESVTEALLRDHPFCKECIPCDLGGFLEVSIEHFIKERQVIERGMVIVQEPSRASTVSSSGQLDSEKSLETTTTCPGALWSF